MLRWGGPTALEVILCLVLKPPRIPIVFASIESAQGCASVQAALWRIFVLLRCFVGQAFVIFFPWQQRALNFMFWFQFCHISMALTVSMLGDVLKRPFFPPYDLSWSWRTLLSSNYQSSWHGLCSPWPTHIQTFEVRSDWLMQYFWKCTITAYGLGLCDGVVSAGWNCTPAELRIVTKAITDTSAVIRVRLREGISHIPVPVTHDLFSGAWVHAHHYVIGTHTSDPPAHTWNQSVDTEHRLVLSKMQRLWMDDLFTGRRKAGYRVARSGTHWCCWYSHCQMKPWIFLIYNRWSWGYTQALDRLWQEGSDLWNVHEGASMTAATCPVSSLLFQFIWTCHS